MGPGFGALKQMNDTIRHNRELLGKKKSLRDYYKEEIKKRTTSEESVNLEEVRMRVAERVKRQNVNEAFHKLISAIVIVLILFVITWFFILTNSQNKGTIETVKEKPVYFGTHEYDQPNGMKLRTEFFRSGPKAAETFIMNGLKNLNSDSFYESGEKFRSAFYYNDTLLTEYFFFKTGDTIQNFPSVSDTMIYQIKLQDVRTDKTIELKLFDNKIITGSYKETVGK